MDTDFIIFWLIAIPVSVGIFFVFAKFTSKREAAKRERNLKEIEERRKALLEIYGNERVVSQIIKQVLWQGETADMVIHSFGRPEELDEDVYKTKKKEVWKYYQFGKGRFGLRVILEDGIVVGWDKKKDRLKKR